MGRAFAFFGLFLAPIFLPSVGPGSGTYGGGGNVVTSVSLDKQGRVTAVTTGAGFGGVTVDSPLSGSGTSGSHLACPSCVVTSRSIATSTGLSGGGNLSADRTLSIDQTFAPTWTGTHRYGSTAQRFTLTNSQLTIYNSTGAGQQIADLGSAFAALRLGNGFNIKWFNDTDISGSAEDVILARTGTSEFGVYLTTSPDVRFKVSDSSTNDDVAIVVSRRQGGSWSLQRVTEAAADSCGSGYRCLRIPN
jgi:hypothetical protein